MRVCPMEMFEPSNSSVSPTTRWPLTKLPLVEPMSTAHVVFPRCSIFRCLRETPGSSMGMSVSADRPRDNACVVQRVALSRDVENGLHRGRAARGCLRGGGCRRSLADFLFAWFRNGCVDFKDAAPEFKVLSEIDLDGPLKGVTLALCVFHGYGAQLLGKGRAPFAGLCKIRVGQANREVVWRQRATLRDCQRFGIHGVPQPGCNLNRFHFRAARATEDASDKLL